MPTENDSKQTKKSGARDLLLKILREANVKPDMLEHDRIGFHYGNETEDEYIVVEADNNHLNIRLIDYAWFEVSRWDIDKISEIQSRLNLQNTYARPKVVYMFNEDNDTMVLSSLLTMPFFEEIPDIKSYFTAQLQSLVDSHECAIPQNTSNEVCEENNKEKKGGQA